MTFSVIFRRRTSTAIFSKVLGDPNLRFLPAALTCMYACTYVCISVYVYVCTRACVCVCAHVCLCVSVCTFVRMRMHVYAYVWVCTCVCMSVCTYSRVCEAMSCTTQCKSISNQSNYIKSKLYPDSAKDQRKNVHTSAMAGSTDH